MKIAIILLSILSVAATVRWLIHKHDTGQGRLPFSKKLNIAVTSLVIGIVVYFGLLLIALAWMTLR